MSDTTSMDDVDKASASEEGRSGEMAGEMPAGADPLLNQEEIDALLGFDEGVEGGGSSGVMALVNSAMVNYERLPMLDVVFDRLVRLMSTTLRNLTSDIVEITLEDVSAVRFGDYIDSIPMPAMLSVFKAVQWDNHGILVADSALIYSIVDVLLGGRRGGPSVRADARSYTTIEMKLVQKMIEVILADLSAAFDPLAQVNFEVDRMETSTRFATITQSGNACFLAKIRVDMGDRGGRIEVLIPYATLEPVRDLLLQMFMGEKFGRDAIWENHLTEELVKTDIQLQAVLGETHVPLDDMLNWTVGSQVFFPTEVDDEIELRCGTLPLFKGPVGQKMGAIAVQVEHYIRKKRGEDADDA